MWGYCYCRYCLQSLKPPVEWLKLFRKSLKTFPYNAEWVQCCTQSCSVLKRDVCIQLKKKQTTLSQKSLTSHSIPVILRGEKPQLLLNTEKLEATLSMWQLIIIQSRVNSRGRDLRCEAAGHWAAHEWPRWRGHCCWVFCWKTPEKQSSAFTEKQEYFKVIVLRRANRLGLLQQTNLRHPDSVHSALGVCQVLLGRSPTRAFTGPHESWFSLQFSPVGSVALPGVCACWRTQSRARVADPSAKQFEDHLHWACGGEVTLGPAVCCWEQWRPDLQVKESPFPGLEV